MSQSDKKSKRSAGKARKPRISWTLAASVVALQAGLLLTLAASSRWQPPKVRALEATWAWLQSVSLYPLLMLIIGGPCLTWLACRLDRSKIGVLAVCWAAFGLTLVWVFGAEAQTMLHAIWERIPV